MKDIGYFFKLPFLASLTGELMRKGKPVAFLSTIVLLSIVLGASINFAVVFGWSNGGFSSDPNNPKYGTHDFIAQYALRWQVIIPNLVNFPLNAYLYGTELPDNGQAPDGIGDTAKHHVYYFSNGSLQDDSSAVRAQQEFVNAVSLFKAGKTVEAAERLGMVAHYISDVAVFGHVMGSATDWGPEIHHSDYEDYVNERTNSYYGEFVKYLAFDGKLQVISAYNATLTLAYDTTFDLNGNLTAVWMDQNYNWTNPTFANRCGESLNLAVNLVADVLHTFALEILEHYIDVPFYYQANNYYCGPAALQMVFDFCGENIPQIEIADAARTDSASYSTYTDEMRRAGHFSNVSLSMGNEKPGSIRGYTLRWLGYASSETFGMDLTQLKSFIDEGKPLILLMWDSRLNRWGHYRVATGYNDTHIFLHDPWKKAWGGEYGGPNQAIGNDEFLELWAYSGNWALYVSPWIISVSAPDHIETETPFQVNVTIAYPQPLPNTWDNYPASLCNATMMLSSNLRLAEGEIQKKMVGGGLLEAGANSTVSWMLVANSSTTSSIGIETEGMVSGFVGGKLDYPPYDYSDRIGAIANFTLFGREEEDRKAPFISIPSRTPEDDVQHNQDVNISVYITDIESKVENVTLFYTIDNGTAWASLPMNYNSSTHLYKVTILGQPAGTSVRFKIVAYDPAGNNATIDGAEPYCTYIVVPEFPSALILPIFICLVMLAIVFKKRKIGKNIR
jgi:hypothetical protein